MIDSLYSGQDPRTWLPDFERFDDGVVQVFKDGSVELRFMQTDTIEFFQGQIQGKPGPMLPDSFSDVFHLASIIGGRRVIDGDPMLVATDLAIDSLFFRWAVLNRDRIGRILYASSSAAYPVDLQGETGDSATRLVEDMIKFDGRIGRPDMTYGWSKLTGEYLAQIAASGYGMKTSCVRPFSGYGEDQDSAYPIPAIAERALRHEDPLTIWGSGHQGRDFVHIEDCIDAFFIIMDHAGGGRGVNIGSGVLTTFMEIAQMFADLEGYTPVIAPLADRPTGVMSRYCDPSLVRSYGWTPKIKLRDGLSRVLDFRREHV